MRPVESKETGVRLETKAKCRSVCEIGEKKETRENVGKAASATKSNCSRCFRERKKRRGRGRCGQTGEYRSTVDVIRGEDSTRKKTRPDVR